MFSSLIFAISSRIDSLGIGITYGIKKTKISLIGKLILFIISLITAYISIIFGNIIQFILPEFLTKLIGNGILILMGLYIIFEAFKENNNSPNVFNNPISSDFDNSKVIDSKEALFLAVALSLDSFCIGICGSIADINLVLFPIFAYNDIILRNCTSILKQFIRLYLTFIFLIFLFFIFHF